MPSYDYQCDDCGNTQEVFQSITDKRFKKLFCKSCNKFTRVTRLIGSGGGVIFKGSGFYATDYRTSNYKEGAKKDSNKGSESGGE